MRITRKQGNSLWLNVPGTGFDLIDTEWDNWSGVYALKDSAGVSVLSGSLSKDPVEFAMFYLHLGGAVMSSIDVGLYKLVFEVRNTTVDYVQEMRPVELAIAEQDI